MCASTKPGTTYLPPAWMTRDRVLAQAGDEAVADGHVGLEPLAGEDGEDPPALDDDVGELVAAGHREASREIHAGTVSPADPGGELH